MKRRNARATGHVFWRLIKEYGQPPVLVADKPRSYSGGARSVKPDIERRAHNGLSNRVEVSHRPTRKREKILVDSSRPLQARRFLANFDQINVIFRPRRYTLSAAALGQDYAA